MLADALEGGCMFSVARLVEDEGSQAMDKIVAPVGTVGLVRASREADDGTSELLLHGVMRVRFLEWHDDRDYPCATIEPVLAHFEPADQAEAAMKTLRGAVEDAVAGLPEDVQSQVLAVLDRADEPCLMTDIVCQQLVHDPDFRQRLLEIDSAGARIPLICEYFRKVGVG